MAQRYIAPDPLRARRATMSTWLSGQRLAAPRSTVHCNTNTVGRDKGKVGVMRGLFHSEPVGWPSAAAFILGMLVFFATVIMARMRASKNAKVDNTGKAN